MKNTKKIFAILFALILVFSTSSVVFADSGYDITVNSTAEDHIYTAYQVFTGDLSGSVLSNIGWGADVDGDALLTAIKGDSTFGSGTSNLFKDCTYAKDVAEVMSASTFTSAMTEKFAKDVLNNLNNPVTNSGWDDDSTETGHGNELATYVIHVDDPGYYLITDELADQTQSDAESALILKVIKDETVTPKAVGVPTLDKVIDDNSTDVYGVSDYKVGDTVNYVLSATLPAASVYDKYEAYKIKFNDTLDAGLTLDKTSIKVYKGTTEITSATGVTVDTSTNQKLYVTIADTKATGIAAAAGDTIYVKYSATINENVVKSGADNENRVTLEFSHDPNNSAEYSVLPEKKVTVWTFDFTLTKTFSDSQNHTAGFTLYRKNGTTETAVGTEKTVSTNAGTLTWNDLEDGTYVLKETTIPDGFNTADDVEFTITTTLAADGSARQTMTSSNSAVSANKDTGDVTTSIENQEGSTLPSTGGIGTTIFYVVGSILVAGTIVLFVVKRRINAENK